MGFEPFIMPKRAPEKLPEGAREDKVVALAKLLHSRGITSSMTDAKRLAEGMVEVERKVVKQESKTVLEKKDHTDIAGTTHHPTHHSSFTLELPESFAHFVAHAAALSHAEVKSSESIAVQAPLSYGREQQKEIPEVPHVPAHKQVFYEDAPKLSETRGFRNNEPLNLGPELNYETPLNLAPPIPHTRSKTVEITTGEDEIRIERTEYTPDSVVIEEKVLIREEAPVEIIVDPEQPPQKVSRTEINDIDLFEFFKKK